jgi:hypothetical protein
MRGVPLLVRLAQHELEERRSDLGGISRARSNTEAAIGEHDQLAASEVTIAMADPAALSAFSAWSSRSAQGRAKLQDRFVELDRGALAARENVRDAAAKVRRLEIVVEAMSAKARRFINRQADARADERELTRHGRVPPAG